MKNERLKLIYLIMLFISLIVFSISLYAFLNIKTERSIKLKNIDSVRIKKDKPITNH